LHLGIDAFWGGLPLSQFELQQVPGPLLNAAMRGSARPTQKTQAAASDAATAPAVLKAVS